MNLNSLKPAKGAKTPAKRVGRGIGCGKGKTCGRGHKGQKARAGGFHKLGFEGGQMPLQRRIPKSGFRSRKSLLREEIRLSDLANLDTKETITLVTLKAAGLANANTKYVKIIGGSKEFKKALNLSGIPVSASTREAILAAGGKVDA